jgi:hypothetical protein
MLIVFVYLLPCVADRFYVVELFVPYLCALQSIRVPMNMAGSCRMVYQKELWCRRSVKDIVCHFV